jgi:hypothetical protein
MKRTILVISMIIITVTVIGAAGIYAKNIFHMSDIAMKNCGGGSSQDSKDDSDTGSHNNHNH